MSDPATAPPSAWRELLYASVVSGVPAGAAAGLAMAATVMSISEVSSEPTAVPGIDSSTWTPLTGITALLFGVDAFHGDFDVLSILFGFAAHMALAIAFGMVGVALVAVVQGPRPGKAGAVVQGVFYALAIEVFFLNLVINSIQEVETVYESLPQWGWWAGHLMYGMTLGLVTSQLGAGVREV